LAVGFDGSDGAETFFGSVVVVFKAAIELPTESAFVVEGVCSAWQYLCAVLHFVGELTETWLFTASILA
jgi:hypothetical protein